MITGNLPDLPLALLIDPAVPKITDIDRLPGKHDHRHGRSHGIDPVACAVAAHCLIHNLAGLQKKILRLSAQLPLILSIVFPEFLGRQISCHLALALSSHSIENDQHRKALPKPLTAAHFLHSQILGRKNLPTAPEIIFII